MSVLTCSFSAAMEVNEALKVDVQLNKSAGTNCPSSSDALFGIYIYSVYKYIYTVSTQSFTLQLMLRKLALLCLNSTICLNVATYLFCSVKHKTPAGCESYL